MARTSLRSLLTFLAFLFCLELGLTPTRLSSVKAELATQGANTGQTQTPMIQFRPPTDDDDPGDTASGGTRGTCATTETTSANQMAALIPQTHRGLTLQSHPTVFLYVPLTSAREILFTLKDENDTIRYQNRVPVSQTQGIVSIELPKSELPLDIGKTYQWFAIALCHADEAPLHSDSAPAYSLNDPWVQGWVRRIEPNAALRHQLDTNPSLELAALYAANGIWFDTLETLVQLRRVRPQDATLAREWTTLLESVGLEDLASQPLVD